MKRFTCILLFLVLGSPAWAGRKITVSELEEMLRSMQQEKKNDVEIATALKQVELSEELTRASMNAVVKFAPGPMATEQVYVLQASSAELAPPPSDLPSTAAPDAAAQRTILAKAEAYASHVYSQLPTLTATRTTLRFQDNMDAVAPSSGVVGSGTDMSTTAGTFSNSGSFVHFINSGADVVTFEHGAEKLSAEKEKIPWGANKMIAVQSPDPNLGIVFQEANSGESIRWLRWELVDGKPMAVFSFVVAKKQSKLDLKVCCFPKLNQTGVARIYTATTGPVFGEGNGAPGSGGVSGNFQTNTEWHDFRSTVPYQGEFFIDPNTGVVVRMITQAELKASDVVHQVDTRVDYAPVNIGGRSMIAPLKTFINTVVVPGGDSGAAIYATRRTLFISEYSGYSAISSR